MAIQPVRRAPSNSQIGWRIRVDGVPVGLAVATVHHTIRWAISRNAGATSSIDGIGTL